MTALSADRPSSNLQDDLFGHAPFAESLARAFLGQLQAVLPTKSEKFKKLGDLLADGCVEC